jgi:hypothetical protein
MAKISAFLKMMSGECIQLECSLDITSHQFYGLTHELFPNVQLHNIHIYNNNLQPLSIDDSSFHLNHQDIFSVFIDNFSISMCITQECRIDIMHRYNETFIDCNLYIKYMDKEENIPFYCRQPFSEGDIFIPMIYLDNEIEFIRWRVTPAWIDVALCRIKDGIQQPHFELSCILSEFIQNHNEYFQINPDLRKFYMFEKLLNEYTRFVKSFYKSTDEILVKQLPALPEFLPPLN